MDHQKKKKEFLHLLLQKNREEKKERKEAIAVMKWLWISPFVSTIFRTDSFLSNTAYDTFGKMQIAERRTRLWDISSHDRNLSHICLSLPAHRCYTAVCSEKEKTSPPAPPRGEGSLRKVTFTHKVLMCLCEQMCVCVLCVCVCHISIMLFEAAGRS